MGELKNGSKLSSDISWFYYNSRGSHFEAFTHWLELLIERERISRNEFDSINETAHILQIKLNNFIKSTAKNARNNIY